MALEDSINALTVATNNLAAIMSGKAGAATSTAAATAGKPAGKAGAGKPKNTAETVSVAAANVKEQIGKEAAVHLINTVGGVEKLAMMKPEKYDAFVAACEKAIEAGEVEGMAAADADEM